MKISQEELAARLAEADRVRAQLRRATLELRALGRAVLDRRADGVVRPPPDFSDSSDDDR